MKRIRQDDVTNESHEINHTNHFSTIESHEMGHVWDDGMHKIQKITALRNLWRLDYMYD